MNINWCARAMMSSTSALGISYRQMPIRRCYNRAARMDVGIARKRESQEDEGGRRRYPLGD